MLASGHGVDDRVDEQVSSESLSPWHRLAMAMRASSTMAISKPGRPRPYRAGSSDLRTPPMVSE